MSGIQVEQEPVQAETSIVVHQKFRGVALYVAIVVAGALLIILGFVAGMRTSTLALLVFVTGCLVVVGAILKLAIAIGDRKPVLVLAPRELIDARRPAYDQAARWSAIQKIQVVYTARDGAEPECIATLQLSREDQPAVWKIKLSGLNQPSKELVGEIEHRIAQAKHSAMASKL